MTPVSTPPSLSALNATTRATGNGALDQSDFLKLMTTQLKTQDPFAPMDSQQMVAQMAQFSSVAGIAEMNASLKAIAAKLDNGRVGDAAGWIGRNALIPGDFVSRDTTGVFRGQINLDAAADTVTVDMLDANGLIVHSEAMKGVSAGTMTFEWDGTGAAGPLKVRVGARSGERSVPTVTNVWTPITAVQSPGGGSEQRLVTPNGLIAPDAAIRLG